MAVTQRPRRPPRRGPRARGPSQNGRDERAPGFVDIEFEVVALADEAPVGVDHLPVEQVQVQVQGASVGHHCPAFVHNISGIAATEAMTMMTRKMLPRKLVTRPLDLSPMYSGSLAMTRIGK